MAIFASQLMTQASGSVGGLTFLSSSGGLTLRGRAIPVNPNTPRQNHVRALLAYLTFYWIETLSAAQRQAWNLYASNTPTLNRLGNAIRLAGLQVWIRTQLARLQSGLNLIPKAPATFTRGSFTPVTPLLVDTVGQNLVLKFNNTDPWAVLTGGALLVYIARPKNRSITTVTRNFRFAGSVLGNSFIAPISPTIIPLPFRMAIGQKCFFRVVATHRDGRYTRTQYTNIDVT